MPEPPLVVSVRGELKVPEIEVMLSGACVPSDGETGPSLPNESLKTVSVSVNVAVAV